jgi:E3 ubiquitin-protein ligase RNF13
MTAAFGPHLPDDGFEGYIAVANPITACSKIEPPPNVSYVNPKLWIALIQRSPGMFGNCTFDVKVYNAQQAGYSAVIVFNSDSETLIKMSSSGQFNVKIPSVFVGYSTGIELKESYTYANKTYVNISTDDTDLNYLLIPFICVISICFLLAMSIFVS